MATVPYVPSASSSNAFDGYALAALAAEKADPKNADRVNFTPGQKAAALSRVAGASAQVERASRKSCTFEFRALPPFELVPYQRGWRLIGRVLAWRIQNQCAAGNFDAAIANLAVATKFGFDLCGGGVVDASLGLAIVDDARAAAAPYLGKMGAGQLNRLVASVGGAYRARVGIGNAIRNESQNMLLAVDLVQDCYSRNDYAQLRDQLGPEVRDAIQHLRNVKQEDRPAYFRGFAQEAQDETARVSELATKPLAARAAPPNRDDEFRPWKRFARQFFSGPAALLPVYDRTLARTRLLILQAGILSQVKAAKVAPSTLGGFAADMRTDPYSGKPFRYQADGADYRLYSIGEDLKDDGGQSDASGLAPDLLLDPSP